MTLDKAKNSWTSWMVRLRRNWRSQTEEGEAKEEMVPILEVRHEKEGGGGAKGIWRGWESTQGSNQKWILSPQPKEILVEGQKRGRVWEIPFKSYGEKKTESGRWPNNRMWSNLFLMLEAQKECCSSGNLYNHFPRKAMFFFSIPPRANPPWFFPRGTVFPLIRWGFESCSPLHKNLFWSLSISRATPLGILNHER